MPGYIEKIKAMFRMHKVIGLALVAVVKRIVVTKFD